MKKMNGEVREFEINIADLVKEGGLSDYLCWQELKERRLCLNTEVSQDYVDDIVSHILRYNREDKGIPTEERKPIILYISSPGGDVDSGFELIDVISNSKTPVYTVNMGSEYSMAFLIGLAGHKRYTMKNAKFLMHDGQGFVVDSNSKIQDTAKFLGRIEQSVRDYIISHTKISAREYNKNKRVEWYMFAEDAKAKGVVDFIIGVDCEMDEVV